MKEGVPQLIFLALMCFNFAVYITNHGEPRDDWNFWDFLGGSFITISLLILGGYFDVFLEMLRQCLECV